MNRGLRGLEVSVLERGLCTACGACMSLCPYLRSWQGRCVRLDQCDLDQGRCFAYCPRTEVDLEEIHKAIFGAGYEEIGLGLTRRVIMARGLDPYWAGRAQTAGVVSTLIDLALKDGMIGGAVLARRDGDLLPQGFIARNRQDVLACAGSSYVSGPTLEAFNSGPWRNGEHIGIVGLPCQVLALARMKTSTMVSRTPVERARLVIGLFCTWALEHRPFVAYLKERLGDKAITKLDISPPPERLLHLRAGEEPHSIPVEEIRPFIRSGCKVCIDMTAEFSDISVGTVEGKQGWNTVIVRTEAGDALVMRAEEEGALEIQPFPEDRLRYLEEASLLKKRRGLQALNDMGGMEKGYLLPLPERIANLLRG